MKEIHKELMDDVVQRLVKALQPERIYLFGSHAYGTPHRHSDIDLLVVVPDSDKPEFRREMDAYRALSGCMAPVDVLVLTRKEMDRRSTVICSLPSTVQRRGKIIYDA